MRQRDSIDLPVLSVAPQNRRAVSQAVSLSLSRFFLEGNNTDVDILFLDVNDIHRAIREGRGYASKLGPTDDVYKKLQACDTLQDTPLPTNDIASTVDEFCRATKGTVAALVLTFANGNVLTVAGSASNYYIFDVVNQIFASVQHPLYDVMEYHNELGECGAFLAHMWALKTPAVVMESESEAPPTPVKKAKCDPVPPIAEDSVKEEEDDEPKKKKPRTVRKKPKKEQHEGDVAE